MSWLILVILVVGFYFLVVRQKPINDQKSATRMQSPNSKTQKPVRETPCSVSKVRSQAPSELPKISKRPHINRSTNELKQISSSNWDNLDILEALSHELSFRSRKKAETLHGRISERLADLKCSSFSWPTTTVATGSQNLSGKAFRHDEGLLRHYGYKVGINGLNQDERIKILNFVFVQSYLPLEDRTYVSEWGEAQTSKRLKKLADSIAAFTRNAKRRSNPNFEQAIRDWEADLAYLKRNYYDNRFSFRWPKT